MKVWVWLEIVLKCFRSLYLQLVNFQLNGYHIIRSDYPSNAKRGGVYIYHNGLLDVCLLKLSNLRQCVVCEVFWKVVKVILLLSAGLQAETILNLKIFLSVFDELLSKTASCNSLFTVNLGDVNSRSSSWWKEGKTTAEGTHLEALTSLHDLACSYCVCWHRSFSCHGR